MHRIIRADEPGDYVLATGETRSVRDIRRIGLRRGRPQHRMARQGCR